MSVTRSTWVDDDGSNTLGTIVGNDELQEVYDNIDLEIDSVPAGLTAYKTGALKQDFNHDHPIVTALPPLPAGSGHKEGSGRGFVGLLAAIPTAGVRGRKYYATDTLQQFYDDGVVWVEIRIPAGAPGVIWTNSVLVPEGTPPDETFSVPTALSRKIHYYHDLTINALLTVTGWIVLYISGTLTINAQVRVLGDTGGISGGSANGSGGTFGGAGGGGGQDTDSPLNAGAGGGIANDGYSNAGGAPGVGSPGNEAGGDGAASTVEQGMYSLLNLLHGVIAIGGGGGAGSFQGSDLGGNGGQAGGGIYIVADAVVWDSDATHKINCDGANGLNAPSNNGGGGGGGGGGVVYVRSRIVSGTPKASASGGAGGAGGVDAAGAVGGAGRGGAYFIEQVI